MERQCVVPGCVFSEITTQSCYFQFPLNNRELLKKWIESMNFLDFNELDINEVLVCEKHFDNSKIVRRNGLIQGLIPDAVPTIFLLPDQNKFEAMPQTIIEQPLQSMVLFQDQEANHVNEMPMEAKEMEFDQHQQLQLQQQQQIQQHQEIQIIEHQEQQGDPEQLLEDQKYDDEEERHEEIDDSGYDCRFCLRGIEDMDESILIDGSIRKHFKNLTNIELKQDSQYSDVSCKKCYDDIKRSSQVKSKVILNQRKLAEIVENKGSNPVRIKQELEDDFFYSEGNLEVQIQENEGIKQEYDEEESEDEEVYDNDDGDYEYSTKKYTEKKYREKRRSRVKRRRSKVAIPLNPDEEDRKRKLQRKYDHAKEKILCTECGQYFSRGSIRFHHLRIHIKTPKFQCDLCDKFFYRKEECRNHMKTHSKSRTKDVSCELCTKQFSDSKNLKMHIKKFHLKIGNICCELCGKSFTNIVNYQNHMRSTHTLERAFKCDECECSYFSKGDLVDHKNRCHSNEPANCTICNKVFTSKVALRNHTKRIHAEHTFICTFEACGKKFVNNHLLQKHQKVHLGLKDHECQLCGMRYYRNFDLKRHILNIHMKVKIPCEMAGCKSLFARKETYRNHILTHHKDIGEENVQIMLLKIRNMQLPKPQLDSTAIVLE